MKISDLDLETKRIVVIAHAILQYPTEHNFKRLEGAIHDFDVKHHDERAINLIRALQIDLTNAAVEKAMARDQPETGVSDLETRSDLRHD